jgi:Fe-S-cluster-containing dehydrogenase component
MTMDRRTLLKGAAVAGAGVAVSTTKSVEASERVTAPPDAVGMLYDATRCIGCQACVTACKTANNLPGNRYDPPNDLDGYTKNIIKLYEGDGEKSYMKQQCMHCIDPGCVNACMIGAFKKREFGIITWDKDRCIGCRYCCNHMIVDPATGGLKEGVIPGCCQACPKEAVIFGTYEELLADAKQRIADHPERYYPAGDPQIFGDTEGGGTQVLYLADVSFEKLGLPDLGDVGVGLHARSIQHGIYKGFIAPVALYGILGAVIWRNRRAAKKGGSDE